MDTGTFMALFLTITFILHGIAFGILGFMRCKSYYFYLTGTFTFLTAIYLMKLVGWSIGIPGTGFSVALLLRICAMLCTLSYLRFIYNEEGSWMWKIRRRLS
ncbi:MAG: hypothetical protein ACREP8_10250, partial [Candidatus Binatia bacterium]